MNIWIDIMYKIINYDYHKLNITTQSNINPYAFPITIFLHELNIKTLSTSYNVIKPFYHNKLIIWEKHVNNKFYTSNKITELWNIYCNTQRAYYGFSKLALLFKLKHAKISVINDLCMNPITITTGKSISIFQNGSIYYFTLSDLINICKSALIHSPNCYSDPIFPKNPYINIQFTKSIMYYIYYSIRISYFRIPLLLHLFYLSDFNINRFYLDNEAIIRDEYIDDFVKNGSNDDLLEYIYDMIYKVPNKECLIKIDHDFPSDTLIHIMRPYLKLYLISILSLSKTEKQFRTYYILKYKLHKFFEFNPSFGRRIYIRNAKRKFIESYNTTHILFNDIHINNVSLLFNITDLDMIRHQNRMSIDDHDSNSNHRDNDDNATSDSDSDSDSDIISDIISDNNDDDSLS